MTTLEQRDRLAQVLLHLGFSHLREQDIPLCKMVEEPARIGAIVPDDHQAVLLIGQEDLKFDDYFVIGL